MSTQIHGNLFIGGSSWTRYTPTWGGFSVAPTVHAYYQQIGKLVVIRVGTDISGTSNDTILTMSLPLFATQDSTLPQAMFGVDVGANLANPCAIVPGGNVAGVYKTFGQVGSPSWTASGNKYIQGVFFYETTA